jgi:NAD(P)-dependent dehydrogenase (short-subunit alcohol dehydrogenase family)
MNGKHAFACLPIILTVIGVPACTVKATYTIRLCYREPNANHLVTIFSTRNKTLARSKLRSFPRLNPRKFAMLNSTPKKRLLLFGASRGLGLALAEEYLNLGWHVVATVRDGSRTSLHDLVGKADGLLDIEVVDINDPAKVAALHGRIGSDRFDLLFVNAGVKNDDRETIADVSTEEFIRVMVTNALSPMRVVETFKDLVPPTGAIAIMSSGQGSVSNNETGGYEVYRASKAALNILMRSFAARHRDDPRTLLLLAPGWVRTDMGGPMARLSIRDSIPNLVKVIGAQEGKGGLQYLDYLGRAVPW